MVDEREGVVERGDEDLILSQRSHVRQQRGPIQAHRVLPGCDLGNKLGPS